MSDDNTKMGLMEKLKLAKIAWFFIKHFPKLAIASAISGVSYYGYQLLDSQLQQLKELKESVVELKTQNQAIKDANEAIVADMKLVKDGMNKYQNKIVAIKADSQKLNQQYTDPKFQSELKTDIKKADQDFNGFYNKYMNGIQEDANK